MAKDDYVRLMSIIPSVIDEKLKRIQVKIQIAVRNLLAKELLDLRREFGELLKTFQDERIAEGGPVIISVGESSELPEVRRAPVVSKSKHDPKTAVACRSIAGESSYRLRFEIPMILIGLANWKRFQEHYEYTDVAHKQASPLIPKELQRESSKELVLETNSKTLTQETTDEELVSETNSKKLTQQTTDTYTTLQMNHEQSNTIQSEIKTHIKAKNRITSVPKSPVELLEMDTAPPVPRETAEKPAKRSYETDDEIPQYWNYRESPSQHRADAPKTLFAKRQLKKNKEMKRQLEELNRTQSSKRLKSKVYEIAPTSHESPKMPTKRRHDNDLCANNAKQRKVQQYLEFPIDKKVKNTCEEIPPKVKEAIDSEPNFNVRMTSLDLDLVRISSLGVCKKREKSSEKTILYRNIVNNTRKDEKQASMNKEASLVNISSLGVDKKREKSREEAILYRNIVNNTRKNEKQAFMNTEASLRNLEVTAGKIGSTKNKTERESKHNGKVPVKIQEAIDLDAKFSVQTFPDSVEKAVSYKNIVNNTSKDEHRKPMDGDNSSQNLGDTAVKLDEKINDSKNKNVKNSKHKKDQEKIAIDQELLKTTPYPIKTKISNTAELSAIDDITVESLENIKKTIHELSVKKNTVLEQTVVDTEMQNLKINAVEIDEKINYSKNTNVKSSKHNHEDGEKDTGDRELPKGTSDPVNTKIADMEAELIYINANTDKSFQNIGNTLQRSSVENNSIEDQTPVDTATRNFDVTTLKMDENINSKNITIDTTREFIHSIEVSVKLRDTMNLEHNFSLQPSLDSDVAISYENIVINTSKDEQRISVDAEPSTQHLQPMKLNEKIHDSKNANVKNSKHNIKDRQKNTINRDLQRATSGQGKTKISNVRKQLNTKKNVVDNNIIENQATVKRGMQNLEATVKIDKKVINEKKEDKNRKGSTKNSSNETSKETTSGADIRHQQTPSSSGVVSQKAKKPSRESAILPNKNDVINTRNENDRDDVMTLEDAVQNLETKTIGNKNAKRDHRKESRQQKKTVETETVHQSKAPDTDKTEMTKTVEELSAINLTTEESGQNTMKEMQENELPNDLTAVDAIMKRLKATSIKIDKDDKNSKTVDLIPSLSRRQRTRWANASPPAKVLETTGPAAVPVKMQCKENNFSCNINNQETSSYPDLCEVSSTELELISIFATPEKSVINSAVVDEKIHNTRNIPKDARKGLKTQLKKTVKENPYPDLCEVSSTGLDFSVRATPEKYIARDFQNSRHRNRKSEGENPEPQQTPPDPEISDKRTDSTTTDLTTENIVIISHENEIRKITVEEQLELIMAVDTITQNSGATPFEIDRKTKKRNTNKDSKKNSKYDSKITANTTDLELGEMILKTEKAIISVEGSELNSADKVTREFDKNGVKNPLEPGDLVGSLLQDFGVADEIKNDNQKFDKKKREKVSEIQNKCKVPDEAVEAGIELKDAGKNTKLFEEPTVVATKSQKNSKRNTKNEKKKPETATPQSANPLRCFRKTLSGTNEIKTPVISEVKKFNATCTKVDEPIKSDENLHSITKNTSKNKKSEILQLKEINNFNTDLTTPIKGIETPAPTQSPHFVVRRKKCIVRNK